MRINLNLYLFVIHVVSNFIKLRVPNITSPSGLSELATLGVEIYCINNSSVKLMIYCG
jgi:hypothetical protein